jgi:anion transporter
MMLIGACIIGETLFETGAADKVGQGILRIAGKNQRTFTTVAFAIAAVLSSVLSNTAVVAAMLPVAAAAAATSNGRITKKNTFMAIGIGANLGGSVTLVGSSTNLIGQGILIDSGVPAMSFFDLTVGSIPRIAICMLFYMTIGNAIQDRCFNFHEISSASDSDAGKEESGKAPAQSQVKMWLSIIILLLTIIAFVAEIWTFGMVAMVAGLACIATGCISMKEAFRRMDWTTIWVVAGSLGFAYGLDKSGAGELLAKNVIGLFGGNISQFAFLVLFSLLSIVMANFMSSTATMALLAPIAIFMAKDLGYDAKAVVMALVWSINLAFATPVGTAPITMTLAGGYRFKDYVIVGGLLVVVCTIATICIYPLVFDL